jgi:hypothetical protein
MSLPKPHILKVEIHPRYTPFTPATVEHIQQFLNFAVQDYMAGDDAQIPYQGVSVVIEPYEYPWENTDA